MNHGFNIAVIMDCFHPSTTEVYLLNKIRSSVTRVGDIGKWRWKRMTSLNGVDYSQIEFRIAADMTMPKRRLDDDINRA